MTILPLFSSPRKRTFVPRCSRRLSCADFMSVDSFSRFGWRFSSFFASSASATRRSVSRTDQPSAAARPASLIISSSSGTEASTRQCPAESLSSSTSACNSSGRLSRRTAFAMAGRDFPRRFATSSCVRSCSSISVRMAAASSSAFRFSR